jgi:hypothetical protein
MGWDSKNLERIGDRLSSIGYDGPVLFAVNNAIDELRSLRRLEGQIARISSDYARLREAESDEEISATGSRDRHMRALAILDRLLEIVR